MRIRVCKERRKCKNKHVEGDIERDIFFWFVFVLYSVKTRGIKEYNAFVNTKEKKKIDVIDKAGQ